MEKKIFMKVLNTPADVDEFKKKLNKDPGCTYHYTQVIPLTKLSHINTRIVVIYVHDNEVE